jgi:hypothetical protein
LFTGPWNLLTIFMPGFIYFDCSAAVAAIGAAAFVGGALAAIGPVQA